MHFVHRLPKMNTLHISTFLSAPGARTAQLAGSRNLIFTADTYTAPPERQSSSKWTRQDGRINERRQSGFSASTEFSAINRKRRCICQSLGHTHSIGLYTIENEQTDWRCTSTTYETRVCCIHRCYTRIRLQTEGRGS